MATFPTLPGFDPQRFIDRAKTLVGQARDVPAGGTIDGAPPTANLSNVRGALFDPAQIFDRLTMPTQLFGPQTPGSSKDIGWLMPLDADWERRLMTEELLALHKTTKTGRRVLPDNADNFAYLFVPGLFTEHYPGYMRENMRRMKQRGCSDVVMSKIDTDASVRTNAAQLKQEIEALEQRTGKKVVLIGHSKGGVDAGAALELYPELRSKVKAFVSLQAPFGGTPIASDIGENENLRSLITGFIRQAFQGDPTSLTDLSYKSRRELIGDRVGFTADVPTFSFASKSRDPGSLTALAALYGRERYGVEGDGLVLWKDALIPGSRGFMILDELDHAGPAMGGTIFSRFRPGDLTEATIALALRNSD